MTALDVADLAVIGGRVLGIGTGAALEQVDTHSDLDPPQVAAIVVQCLASGRIEPDDMAGWLAARLSAPAAPIPNICCSA